ncbi:3-oxo-5-alpha-steroid 4-dehydrogenase-domain-containing protein [Coprinopsis sp. MPI-PUGE-AT-0042]|nr:3-oxo-5-alpha-steroid 4-dehydrogenase-domain-containing protein [Coprinopsis sp. MPI-PUGE-AT-0042]
MVSLTISSATSKSPFLRGTLTLDVSPDATVADVKRKIAQAYPKFYTSRQKLSLKGDKKGLEDDAKLETALKGQTEVQVKDLGPQMGWRTVYLIEYVGPLIIHPLIYYFPKVVYGTDVQHSALQKCIFGMVMAHFIKRELETIFVHRFSHGTMPFLNVFRNSGYYHLFYGLFLALDVYRPKYAAGSPHVVGTYRDDKNVLMAGIAFWLFAQYSNFHAHMTLRNLRPPGTRTRGIPRGYGFELVSCPNYFFEILAWLVPVALTSSIASYTYITICIGILSAWALQRHRNYKKDFKDYPRGRKALFPFIL